MKKSVLIPLVGVMVAGFSLLSLITPAGELAMQVQASPLLDEVELTTIALTVAQERGLVGEPTQTHAQFIQSDEWDVLMFSYVGMNTPDREVFLFAAKGEFSIDTGRGMEVPAKFNITSKAPAGITIALDAATGEVLALTTRYIDDPASEITYEERTQYELLRSINLEEMAATNSVSIETDEVPMP